MATGISATQATPQFSSDPALEAEWQAFKAELQTVRAQFDKPWLSHVDGDLILDLLTRQIDLIRRMRASVTPPKWRKGQEVVRLGCGLWWPNVCPADRNVYVVTQDSWGDSPTWIEPRETAKI